MQRFWDKSRFLWVVFIFSVVSLPLLFVNQVVAQADDCGNGLPQQLTIGSVGWVIPEPPEAVNVRDAPGGNKVAQIQPTEQFTVLEGPECNQTYSWWKIESETGVLGWIAEGTDHYFVEPLAIGGGGGSDLALNADYSLVINDEIQCDGEPNFEVGQAVRLANENPRLFYGHPLLTNGLFPVDHMGRYYESYYGDNPLQFWAPSDQTYFLIDGGYCVNGKFFWKIGYTGTASLSQDARLHIVRSDMAYWVAEEVLALADAISIQAPYNPTILNLIPNTSAPLVHPEQQVSYIGSGGSIEYPAFWNVENCSLGDMYTAIGYADLLDVGSSEFAYSTRPCVEVYPLAAGVAIVRIYQPDGSLFSEQTLDTHSLTISRALMDGEALLQTTSVTVDVPNEMGLMTGIWQIEVAVGDVVTRRSYHLIEDELTRIQSFCEGAHPRYWLNNFVPDQAIDLVYVAVSDNAPENFGDDVPFVEVERWTLNVDARGDLLIDLGFQPEKNGYFVVVEPDTNWQTHLQSVSKNNPGAMAAVIISRCGNDLASPINIEPNKLVTGTGLHDFAREFGEVVTEIEQYRFEAKMGDHVTISAAIYREVLPNKTVPDIDVALELYDSEGTLIAENDDAANPRFGPLDAEIVDFVIPKDGEYSITLTSTGSLGITSLFINLDRDTSLATPPSDGAILSIGDQVSALLDEQNTWQFEGRADELISILVKSGAFDPVVTLKTVEGTVLVSDDDSGDDLNPYFEFTPPADGIYVIEVSGWGDKIGEYILEISQP